MRVFLDDFAVYEYHQEHLDQLQLCLERCRHARLNLNLAKCVLGVSNDALLRHIVSSELITMDPDKVITNLVILAILAPTTVKALS